MRVLQHRKCDSRNHRVQHRSLSLGFPQNGNVANPKRDSHYTASLVTDRLVLVSRQNANRSIQDLFAHFEQRFDQLMQDEHFVDPSIASPQKFLLLWPIEFLPPRAHYEEVCFDASVHKKCTNDETSS